jgi:hypothetical protein
MTMRQALFLSLVFAFACGGHVDQSATGDDASDDVAGGYGGGIASLGESVSGEDATAATYGDAQQPDDAAAEPPFDAGPEGTCARPLSPGDLTLDELMIESVSGTGDHGEWLEVTSTLDCTVDLLGLHGECPRGAKAATFDITGDLWLPPGGTFVVADSIDPAVNHYLPGTVVAWSGNLGDVLRNKGTTVTLLMNDVVIDTLTYPAVSLTVGASLSFPSDCDPASRSDWTLWQTSTASWFPGFLGTPNAPNIDVTCPTNGDP